jgi:hypothetical protein
MVCRRPALRGAAMSKMVKVPVLVAILMATLAVSPAQACACGASDWSMMSNEEIVSTVNRIEDEPRILAGQRGELPPPPSGYRYDGKYKLVPV